MSNYITHSRVRLHTPDGAQICYGRGHWRPHGIAGESEVTSKLVRPLTAAWGMAPAATHPRLTLILRVGRKGAEHNTSIQRPPQRASLCHELPSSGPAPSITHWCRFTKQNAPSFYCKFCPNFLT